MAEYCRRNEPDLTQCGRIRPCEHHEPHAHAYVEARREERADVVAWLLARAETSEASYRGAVERREASASAIHKGKAVSLRFAAETIERGEHVGAASKEKKP